MIELTPWDEARRQCQAFGLPTETLRLRLIRLCLKGGEEALLITSLLDEEAFPRSLFKHLYHLRWGMEEDWFLSRPSPRRCKGGMINCLIPGIMQIDPPSSSAGGLTAHVGVQVVAEPFLTMKLALHLPGWHGAMKPSSSLIRVHLATPDA